jgi:hypothetical protein
VSIVEIVFFTGGMCFGLILRKLIEDMYGEAWRE